MYYGNLYVCKTIGQKRYTSKHGIRLIRLKYDGTDDEDELATVMGEDEVTTVLNEDEVTAVMNEDEVTTVVDEDEVTTAMNEDEVEGNNNPTTATFNEDEEMDLYFALESHVTSNEENLNDELAPDQGPEKAPYDTTTASVETSTITNANTTALTTVAATTSDATLENSTTTNAIISAPSSIMEYAAPITVDAAPSTVDATTSDATVEKSITTSTTTNAIIPATSSIVNDTAPTAVVATNAITPPTSIVNDEFSQLPMAWKQIIRKQEGRTINNMKLRIDRLFRQIHLPSIKDMIGSIMETTTRAQIMDNLNRGLQLFQIMKWDILFYRRLYSWYFYIITETLIAGGLTAQQVSDYCVSQHYLEDGTVYAERILEGRKADIVFQGLGAPGMLATELFSSTVFRKSEENIKLYVKYLVFHNTLPEMIELKEMNEVEVLFYSIPKHLTKLL